MSSHRLSDRQRATREQEFNREGGFEREERSAIQDRRAATALVSIWDARLASGRELWFCPTIGAATAGGRPWLQFMCPGCLMVGEVDLHKLGRHPRGSIESIIPDLSCRRCQPNPPFAQLLRLSPSPRRW
jgi:hypothetical protein